MTTGSYDHTMYLNMTLSPIAQREKIMNDIYNVKETNPGLELEILTQLSQKLTKQVDRKAVRINACVCSVMSSSLRPRGL